MTPDTLADLHGKAFSATRSWSRSEFASLLSQPGTILTGDSQCFALFRITLDEAEVLTIATDPTYRRQGLARAALQDAEAKAQTMGATQVFLEVAEDNTAAQALYAQGGYTQVGRRPGYYIPQNGPPVAALVLRKSLSAS